jgi:16S rRNA processing protein RimM
VPVAPADGFVVMGRVVAPYGVAGWVKVQPYTETPEALLTYGAWWLRRMDGTQAWRAVAVTGGRVHGNTVVARLADVDSREAALTLKGCDVAVPRADMPPAGRNEIYWADLVGLEVVNRQGLTLGRVTGVTEHGAHPLLMVARGDGDEGQRLIPYVPAYVDRVDLTARRIIVDWGTDF